jgi:hypothetical protein
VILIVAFVISISCLILIGCCWMYRKLRSEAKDTSVRNARSRSQEKKQRALNRSFRSQSSNERQSQVREMEMIEYNQQLRREDLPPSYDECV